MDQKTATKYFYGVGRRKASTTRAKYYPSNEAVTILVNKQPANEYFTEYSLQTLTNMLSQAGVSTGSFHLFTKGGGTTGQVDSAKLAMSKALVKFDEGYRTILRLHDLLTTDIRKVLPKRAGRRKARKKEQWSKR